MIKRSLAATLLFSLCLVTAPLPLPASTTGSLRGRVVDASTNAPIAGAKITADSPSQLATVTSDASGAFAFISLVPDTYTIRVEKTGYEAAAQAGNSVFADQSTNVSVLLTPALRTIAKVTSRNSGSLVRSGTTSDVYSVNAAGQAATNAVGGSGSLNQAYGAIGSAPGVVLPSGQQGWYQSVYIRGGDFDQVAYEFDGVPVVRQSDLAPIVTLSNLGQQEVQVYTGGTPASSNSSGLAGYINQVIKTGTNPGYVNVDASVGAPTFYHKLSLEVSGATPDRRFSYYIGTSAANQDYRYISQFNGADDPNYAYPLFIPTNNAVFHVLDGSGGPAPNYGAFFSPGNAFAQSTNADRETVANFHYGIAHRHDSGRDDLQLLFVTGNISTGFYSSANDIGAGNVTITNPNVANNPLNFFPTVPVSYLDSLFYNGPVGQAPNPNDVAIGPLPSSVSHVPFAGTFSPDQRDGSSNGFSVEKLQYQRNINDHSFLRALGYSEYTNWFINGPNSAQETFGADLADYEVLGHIYGANLLYSNQLSSKNEFSAQGSYLTQKLQTYNAQFGSTGLGSLTTSYVGSNGNCYNPANGAQWSCFDAGSQGGGAALLNLYTANPNPSAAQIQGILEPGTAAAGTPAAQANAQWVVTEDGHSAQVDNVTPFFTSFSLTDVYQPNDKLLVNFGARADRFAYRLNNLEAGYPARAFWFNAYNNEHCGAVGQAPVSTFDANPNSSTFGTFGSCPTGFQPFTTPGVGFTNSTGGTTAVNVFQPRVAFTYTVNPDTVVRGSYGHYARPTGTSYQQYNTVDQNLPSFLEQFYQLGYTSPDHAVQPDTSDNFDLSLEKHVKGTQLSFKISPFYRSTKNQLQYLSIDALGGTLAGVNVGQLRASGVELSVQQGDFARDGLSYELSYTHTNAKTTFASISNGISVIDSLNRNIQQYNSYSQACAGVTSSSPNWTACGSGLFSGNAQSTFTNPDGNGGMVTVANPYFNDTLAPLLDRNGQYQPYDVIPSPFNAANGYETPDVATLVLNYKHKRFALTPTVTYSSGSFYGSPLTEPGYVPQSCTQDPALTPTTPGISCNGQYILPSGATTTPGVLFIPDPVTHQFDSLGAFRQPWQLTANLQASYEINNRASLTLVANNVYNRCFQRGYAWDDPNVCQYSNLPSNILPPAGNFLTNPPRQLAFPYGPWFNITEVGYTAVKEPFQFTMNLYYRL